MKLQDFSPKFVAFLAILATPMAAGAFLLSWGPGDHWFDFSPMNDGYVAPRDIAGVVDDTQESTVTIYCTISKDEVLQGTGWAIDSELLQVPSKRTTVMTNHHVIDECINGLGTVTISRLFEKEMAASIMNFDEKMDLAVLETDMKLKPLEISGNFIWPGYWVMTLGSAAGYEGSVSFGNVVNTDLLNVLITNNISEGSSGGPLIDNEGKVVGIVTWGSKKWREQFNGARNLDTFCSKILKCEFITNGKKSWYDHSD